MEHNYGYMAVCSYGNCVCKSAFVSYPGVILLTMVRHVSLLAWWVSASALAVWGLWGAPPMLIGVPLVAAAVFPVLLLCCSPRQSGVRVGVYLSALLANQAPAMTGAAWVLLPGHHQHKIPATALGLLGTMASAAVALATFALVRHWVRAGRRWPRPARGRWPVIGVCASAAAVYLVALWLADGGLDFGDRLFGVTPVPYPSAGGGFGAWALETASSGLAGFVEEPVFVGLLVLLWPRLRATTFIALALLSGVARGAIHLYYASGAAHVVTAAVLIVLWSVLWSSVALALIYRTRMLWPVIIAHGVKNALATLGGPFTADTSPLHIIAVTLPFVAMLAIFVTASIYAGPRVVEALLARISRRWPRVGQWLAGPQEAST